MHDGSEILISTNTTAYRSINIHPPSFALAFGSPSLSIGTLYCTSMLLSLSRPEYTPRDRIGLSFCVPSSTVTNPDARAPVISGNDVETFCNRYYDFFGVSEVREREASTEKELDL